MIGAVDDAAFHDEGDLLNGGDVGERIAGDGDDVGEIAGLKSADLILPAEEFRAVEHVRLEGGERRHAVLDHEDEFACLRAVGKWADVGAHGHGNAGGELAPKLFGVKVLHLVLACGCGGRSGVVGEIFGNCERWDGGNVFLTHDAHGVIAEVIGVVDGFDPGFGGITRAGFASGVNGDALADAGGFFDGGAELGFGELVGGDEMAVDERVAARLVHFDEIGAFFDLFADGGDDFVGIIRVIGIGENVLRGIEMIGVLVAAENVDGVAADAQARAGNFAAIDGVTHSSVG